MMERKSRTYGFLTTGSNRIDVKASNPQSAYRKAVREHERYRKIFKRKGFPPLEGKVTTSYVTFGKFGFTPAGVSKTVNLTTRAKRRRMGWRRKGRLARSRVPLGHPLHRVRTKSRIPEAVEQSKNDLLQKEEKLLYSGQGWDIVGRRRVTDLVTGELEKRAHKIHGENIELKWISGNLDGLKTYSLMVRQKPKPESKFLGLKVGDSIGFEKEFKYLGMGAEPPHKRRYKYIPITKVTDEGLEFTETKPPYDPNVFFISWDTIKKFLEGGQYKIRRRRQI